MTAIRVLSIQNPWAWLICNGPKDVENRRWRTHYRGPFLIHAGKKLDPDWSDDGIDALNDEYGLAVPSLKNLPRGGIVGMATLTDCVATSDSEWWGGPFGFVLKDARPLPFFPCPGALGFFKPPADYPLPI